MFDDEFDDNGDPMPDYEPCECEDCGKSTDEVSCGWFIDPYDCDIKGINRWTFVCNDCLQQSRDDI